MPFSNYQWPPPANWQDFELLCLDLWREVLQDAHVQRNGRQGQPQSGVDVYGQYKGTQEWVGIQCKGKNNYSGKPLTCAELEDAVSQAKAFQPQISHFVIATTANRDEKLQQFAREITKKHQHSNLFSVSVFGWQDIVEYLSNYPKVVSKYYPSLADEPTPEVHHHLERLLQVPFAVNGYLLTKSRLRNIGIPVAFIMFGLGFVALPQSFGVDVAFSILRRITFFIAMVTATLILCLNAIAYQLTVKGRRFYHLMLRSLNLEMDATGKLFLTRIGGSCWCGGDLTLVIDEEDHKTLYSVCLRNEAHCCLFDYTLLPEVELDFGQLK